MNPDNSNYRERCRICYTHIDDNKVAACGVLIFGDEGLRLRLQSKIRKYLYITVSIIDKLPKVICKSCCSKIDNFHKLATMAVKNQAKFRKLSIDTDDEADENQQDANKGLLHTYLTKGTILKEPDDGTEEMEVRLDPMMYLDVNVNSDDENFAHDCEDLLTKDIKLEEDIEECHPEEDEDSSDSSAAEELSKYNRFLPTRTIGECGHGPANRYLPNTCVMCTGNFEDEFTYYTEKMNRDEFGNTTVLPPIRLLMPKTDPNVESSQGVKCPICKKMISTKGNLKVHMDTHKPKGKYICDICGRVFKTTNNLSRHKEYHTGIQYTCNVCGRVYPTNSTLRAHSITHSDLRPHKCPLCDKTFKRNQDLKFHINQHTGARPYKCPYCPKAFASSGNCFSHRKRMHPVEVEKDREKAIREIFNASNI